MSIALEVHLGFAFFVFLCALFVGWVQTGRRVMSAVIGIQVLIGLVVAAWAGSAHIPLPGSLWIHIVGALAAMFAYIIGRRMFDRAPQRPWPAIGMSLLGFILVILTIAYGWTLTYPLRG
jgi:CDP-diglyceride synthetase